MTNEAKETDLITEWNDVRATFFPRWDRQGRWRIEAVNDLDGAMGKCETETQTIKLLDGITDDDLTALLIHEIAHAVSSTYHGKIWQARMNAAAEQMPVRIPIQSMTANTTTDVPRATIDPIAYLVSFAENGERENRRLTGCRATRAYSDENTGRES